MGVGRRDDGPKIGPHDLQNKRMTYITRAGKLVKTDAAFDAWTSGDLQHMLRALSTPTNPVDRHFLLQSIVQEAYKKRDNPAMRAKCIQIAALHLAEFPHIAPALKTDMGGTLPRVATFQHFATVLTEDREYDRAIEVCELALQFGLEDGTKSGFEGRIRRIRREQGSA